MTTRRRRWLNTPYISPSKYGYFGYLYSIAGGICRSIWHMCTHEFSIYNILLSFICICVCFCIADFVKFRTYQKMWATSLPISPTSHLVIRLASYNHQHVQKKLHMTLPFLPLLVLTFQLHSCFTSMIMGERVITSIFTQNKVISSEYIIIMAKSSWHDLDFCLHLLLPS